MPDTGRDLIKAITECDAIMKVKDCPGVPVYIGRAVYGTYQDDDNGTDIAFTDAGELRKGKIKDAIRFTGAFLHHTAVWHFMCRSEGPARVHHFVVVPWHLDTHPHKLVYTVFMAYENYYSIREYVDSTKQVFQRPGYKGLYLFSASGSG